MARTPPLTLAAVPEAASTLKILHTAKLAGVTITLDGRGGVSSGGLSVPELDVGIGAPVKGTNPVLRRIAQTTHSELLGGTFAHEALVETWLEWASLEVDYTTVGGGDMTKLYETLEAHMKSRTFLVGQRMTLADISLCISFKDAVEKAGIVEIRNKYPSFVRWLLTCQHQLGMAVAATGQKSGKAQASPKQKAAASPKQKAAASPKQKAAASPKAKAKASPKQKAAASPKAAGNEDAIKAVGDELRILKDRLKDEGVTGKKLNDHPEVKPLVDKLSALKKQPAPAPAAAAAAPAAASAAAVAGNDDAIKAVGDELRTLKDRLKSEGATGKKLNDNPEVKSLVEKLSALKAGGAPAAAKSPAAAPKPEPAGEAQPAAEGGEKSDKKKAKDDAKKAKEDAKKLAQEELLAAAELKKRGPDVTFDDWEQKPFGNLFIQSQTKTGREWTSIKELSAKLKDKAVWLRARVLNCRKQGAKLCFITLRKDLATVQCVLFGNDMAGFGGNLSDESVVDIYGKVSCPDEAIKSATQSDVEIQVERIYCISRAGPLPVQIADLSRPDEDFEKDPTLVRVNQDVRLDNRIIDLRTQANQAIFRIQSGVCALFREYLANLNFTEIHTPKMIKSASEGGADVFRLDYFDGDAYLAQSPQLYKQMALMTDLDRVFEIGPVFRSEKSFTHRHLTEFTGLDMEMTFKDHYSEVLDVLDGLFFHIFEGLNKRFKDEILAVKRQHPFEMLKYKYPCLKLKYPDAIKLLREKGPAAIEEKMKTVKDEYILTQMRKHIESVKNHDEEEDLGTEDEKVLGRVILAEYGEELYIIDKFPTAVRPFYTMGDPNDSKWTNSYDIFLRGEEITSGAQRIHDPKMLLAKAEGMGIDTKPLQAYVDAFKYGSYPHAGAGIGMERVVMLFMGLPNIRKTSMFPRDPKRLEP